MAFELDSAMIGIAAPPAHFHQPSQSQINDAQPSILRPASDSDSPDHDLNSFVSAHPPTVTNQRYAAHPRKRAHRSSIVLDGPGPLFIPPGPITTSHSAIPPASFPISFSDPYLHSQGPIDQLAPPASHPATPLAQGPSPQSLAYPTSSLQDALGPDEGIGIRRRSGSTSLSAMTPLSMPVPELSALNTNHIKQEDIANPHATIPSLPAAPSSLLDSSLQAQFHSSPEHNIQEHITEDVNNVVIALNRHVLVETAESTKSALLNQEQVDDKVDDLFGQIQQLSQLMSDANISRTPPKLSPPATSVGSESVPSNTTLSPPTMPSGNMSPVSVPLANLPANPSMKRPGSALDMPNAKYLKVEPSDDGTHLDPALFPVMKPPASMLSSGYPAHTSFSSSSSAFAGPDVPMNSVSSFHDFASDDLSGNVAFANSLSRTTATMAPPAMVSSQTMMPPSTSSSMISMQGMSHQPSTTAGTSCMAPPVVPGPSSMGVPAPPAARPTMPPFPRSASFDMAYFHSARLLSMLDSRPHVHDPLFNRLHLPDAAAGSGLVYHEPMDVSPDNRVVGRPGARDPVGGNITPFSSQFEFASNGMPSALAPTSLLPRVNILSTSFPVNGTIPSASTMPSETGATQQQEDDDDDDDDEGIEEIYASSTNGNNIYTETGSFQGTPGGSTIPPEYKDEVDRIFFEYLNKICSNLDATDAKGDGIHQKLMPKKMARLDESRDFRPFKFRILAFTTAFLEELARQGYPEDKIPMKKVRNYLWHQSYILRFNEDGKKAKSKGNHIWNVEAKKLDNGKWEFRPFHRKIAGNPPGIAYIGLHWQWSPRVWDPQAVWTAPVQYSSPELPSWLSWKECVLSGVPPPDAKSCNITTIAQFIIDGQEGTLTHSFHLSIVPAATAITPFFGSRTARPSVDTMRSNSDPLPARELLNTQPVNSLPTANVEELRVVENVLTEAAKLVTTKADALKADALTVDGGAAPEAQSEMNNLVKQKEVFETLSSITATQITTGCTGNDALAAGATALVATGANLIYAADNGMPASTVISDPAAMVVVPVHRMAFAAQNAVEDSVKRKGKAPVVELVKDAVAYLRDFAFGRARRTNSV
ncbi:hypothetical protein FISHEDRAFT_78432 [Fistulina hepatica ATCC 64428]|nr:hypothetical protein FISHEDRAFT_78432 [Fistulina hepatica ATCC 64428]